MLVCCLALTTAPPVALAEPPVIDADLLIVGGDESGCAAAVQAARLGVPRVVLVNDIEWLGGQFCTQGIGPVDEWTIVDGKRTEFPASGAFLEILRRIESHNQATYGIANPGNGWCGRHTIEPQAAANIFEDWLNPYRDRIRVFKGWRPCDALREGNRVCGVDFENADGARMRVLARLTADATDWGDVIRLSGARYMAGPDLRSRFQEPSAPEMLERNGHQEMNPISWCPLLREAQGAATIERPARYDARSFADARKARLWVDWDGQGGIYNFSGWSIYTHRRMVDRYHLQLPMGCEAVILNWPAQDYPLVDLPRHVVDALEQDEPGASNKNIVDMSAAQRRIVYDDCKQRALEFVYWLQTEAHDQHGDFPQSFRYMKLAEDYGTPDRLPPKPYIREGLRLESLYVLREQDVRTEIDRPRWARSMVPDGVFGYQFNMDFHPTRRSYVEDHRSFPWQGKFVGQRNWNAHTDRAMFPLRGLVPIEVDGLLGCSKNIGVTSMVQSSLRLHGQMMHVGTAVGTVASMALREGIQPRSIAASPQRIREVQRVLVRGRGGPGLLIWPWHDVRPEDSHFEAANLLTVAGVWQADPESLKFDADRVVSRGELAGSLVRLMRSLQSDRAWPPPRNEPQFTDVPMEHPRRQEIDAMVAWGDFGTQQATFQPEAPVSWSTLARWLDALRLPNFVALRDAKSKDYPLTRAECVDFLYRLWNQGDEVPLVSDQYLQSNSDLDGDGKLDRDDPLPWDRDNDSIADRFEGE